MNDAVRMGFRQSVGDLSGDGQRFVQAERLPLHSNVKRLAFDVLHDDEAAVVYLANFVDRADVRMVESRRRARFSDKTLSRVFICDRFEG